MEPSTMAIVKTNYIKRGVHERTTAKAHIRYMEQRRGKDGERLTRTLFGEQGAIQRETALRLIDEAPQGSYFYRMVISPDAQTEDTKRDLYLREITSKTIHSLEELVDTPLSWVGVIHADHAPHRHIHLQAILQRKLERHELPLLRNLATEACLEQRRQHDLLLEQQQQERTREEAQWER